jgi:hypothetical protein
MRTTPSNEQTPSKESQSGFLGADDGNSALDRPHRSAVGFVGTPLVFWVDLSADASKSTSPDDDPVADGLRRILRRRHRRRSKEASEIGQQDRREPDVLFAPKKSELHHSCYAKYLIDIIDAALQVSEHSDDE